MTTNPPAGSRRKPDSKMSIEPEALPQAARTKGRGGRYLTWVTVALLAAWIGAGCASAKSVWNPRIGVYTRDQAILDLGPPDKEATLADGTVVDEWLTRRGHPGTAVMTGSYYGRPYSHRYPFYAGGGAYVVDPGMPDSFLRLTFGPDGRLQAWKKYWR